MIKQYNFPIIFQPVVGDVIPSHLLQKRENLNQENNFLNDAQSVTTSSNPKSEISKRKFLRIKSKKKELQRRSKIMKTMNFFTYRPRNNQQNNLQNGSSRKHLNFLKKKLTSSDSGGNPDNRNSNIEQTDPIKQFSSLQSQELQNDPQLRKNHFRIRTSLDRASIQEDMYQYKQEEHMISQDLDSYRCENKINQQFYEDYVLQEKYFIKNEPVMNKTSSFQGKKKGGLGIKFNERSNQLKKKTVNFNIAEKDDAIDQQDITNNRRVTFGSNNGKLSREKSKINSRRSKLTRKQTNFSQKSEKSIESKWTDRSVVSIKFSQSDQLPKQKKSLRSNESILNQEQNNMIWVKGGYRKKTGTHKHIVDPFQIVTQKKYKSDCKIKSINNFELRPILSRSKLSQKKIVSIKTMKSMKSGKSINSKQNAKKSRSKKKGMGPRVSLIRKIDNQNILQNVDSLAVSLKDPNFTQTIFKKNTSKNLFKTVRGCNQERNVYEQLNNFHKFLNENETIQSETEIRRTIAKPIVIQNESNIRVHKVKNDGLKNENLMIQVGLQLVRKMNSLAQKRL